MQAALLDVLEDQVDVLLVLQVVVESCDVRVHCGFVNGNLAQEDFDGGVVVY